MSSEVKYIGYVEIHIADTMWPSELCRVEDEGGPASPARDRFDALHFPHGST